MLFNFTSFPLFTYTNIFFTSFLFFKIFVVK
nr:MAG TPA: hypothetical protein [Caudoviricetes sp.]